MAYSYNQLLLKYQKTISKLVEFGVNKEDYPAIKDDYRKLSFPTIYIISEFCWSILKDDTRKQEELLEKISFCCEYYDSAFKAKESQNCSIDFLLEAIISYMLNSDFGSAKALFVKAKLDYSQKDNRLLLIDILNYTFKGKIFENYDNIVSTNIFAFIKNNDIYSFNEFVKSNFDNIYFNSDNIDAFYLVCIFAIVKILLSNSAHKLLPLYSNIGLDKWSEYFEKKSSIKVLWPSQKLLGDKGFLKGESGLIQLPTGVGKTKSIELIIESLFLSNRGKCCVIVVPLRSLCNQISDDLYHCFHRNEIKKISDILEDDYGETFNRTSNTIVICTPEKLQFILHHNLNLLKSIDLIIFDECHMFDDSSRGTQFEMLLSLVKEKRFPSQQIVLMSAVLSNAEDIASWFFDDISKIAYDSQIKTTSKSIGFINSRSQICYYSKDFDNYDFFIPNAYTRIQLFTKLNCKEKYFPENDSKDFALYFANKLCVNGGVAIYASQRKTIKTTISRLIEVKKKGFNFDNLQRKCNYEEMIKFGNYFDAVYGNDNLFSKGALIGVLPHYSSLGFGIRGAIEESFKNNYNFLIICTSTLAEGINIPIKYLILLSTRTAQLPMSTRKFQNLIGRTARSGSFTEGSIIIANPTNFDKKEHNFLARKKWNEVIKKFNPNNSEPCLSSILKLFRNNTSIKSDCEPTGEVVFNIILENINNDWKNILERELMTLLKNKCLYNELAKINIRQLVNSYYTIVSQLEIEICYLLSNEDLSNLNKEQFVKENVSTLFAYYLASDDEKKKIKKLYYAIINKVLNSKIDISKIGKSLATFRDAKLVVSIIENYHLDSECKSEIELLNILLKIYNENNEKPIDFQICINWINGVSFYEMTQGKNGNVFDIENICNKKIAYELSFFVGNIIDFLEEDNPNIEKLELLQKQLKYGVNDSTSIIVCESIVNDRLIAKTISNIVGDNFRDINLFARSIIQNKDYVMEKVKDYPSYFSKVLDQFIKQSKSK